MKIIHAPKDGDRQEWQFDVNDFRRTEAEAIEEVGGTQWETFGEWSSLLLRGGFRAWCAALWIMLRRGNPSLSFEDVDPSVGEFDFDLSNEVEEPGKEEPTEPDTPGTDSP